MFGLDESRKRAKKLSDCIIGIPDVISHGAFVKTTRKMGIAESVTCFLQKRHYGGLLGLSNRGKEGDGACFAAEAGRRRE
jgi:hypothetical protein